MIICIALHFPKRYFFLVMFIIMVILILKIAAVAFLLLHLPITAHSTLHLRHFGISYSYYLSNKGIQDYRSLGGIPV